ncbi:MAG: DUF4163 domain-containing protein [Stenomitos rutilans HA7619-LM2]|jgi:hypothetical protein|nr:DUF4163 domain-containing protein [Stenomitos rutilans HA7619-LM2]
MKFSLLILLLFAGGQMLLDGVLPFKAYGLSSSELSVATTANTAIDRLALSPKPPVNDRVLIESKTVTFTRGKKGQDYPDYKEATIKYPQVTGLTDQTVLQNVQTAIGLKSVIGQSLDELRTEFQEAWWLSEIDYTVNYNQNSLLDLTFTISGVGAYPSTYEKHRLVSLKTGKVLKASDVFKKESFGAIAVIVNKAMQAEMKQATATGDQGGADIRDQLSNKRFQIRNLNAFSINDKGVTFLYDFNFPHVILALQPSGRYFFSYDQLKVYIKPDGALGVFLPKTAAGIRG